MGTCDGAVKHEQKTAFIDRTPDVRVSYAVFQLWVGSRSHDSSVFWVQCIH